MSDDEAEVMSLSPVSGGSREEGAQWPNLDGDLDGEGVIGASAPFNETDGSPLDSEQAQQLEALKQDFLEKLRCNAVTLDEVLEYNDADLSELLKDDFGYSTIKRNKLKAWLKKQQEENALAQQLKALRELQAQLRREQLHQLCAANKLEKQAVAHAVAGSTTKSTPSDRHLGDAASSSSAQVPGASPPQEEPAYAGAAVWTPFPGALWELISDFLESDSLCYVCRRLADVLRRRHMDCNVSHQILAAFLKKHKGDPAIRTLRVHCNAVRDEGAQGLVALKEIPSLTALRLHLAWNWLTDTAACALAGLKEAPLLTSLMLDLMENEVGDVGVQALAELRHAPSLTDLELKLWRNCLTDVSAEAFAQLKEAPALKTLKLDLASNYLGDSGAQALAALKESTTLKSLTLDLGSNEVGDLGAQALAGLKDAPALTALTLGLGSRDITDIGAAALGVLRESPLLCSLTLDLGGNPIGDAGAVALTVLKDAPSLAALDVNMSFESVGEQGKQALLALREVPALKTVHITFA